MKLPAALRSKITAPDTVNVLWIWTFIGVMGFLRTARRYIPAEAGGHFTGFDTHGYLVGRDFVNTWFGAKLALGHKIASVFSIPEYMTELRALFGPDFYRHNFSYPPHVLPLILALGLLPYFPALLLWSAGGLAALAAALRRNALVKMDAGRLLLAALSPACLVNLVSGQNGAFTASLFLGGLYLCETSPVSAGVLFGLLTMKPHLGLLIAPMLLLRKNWKCIASACATTALLVGVSIGLWGTAPWRDYFANILPFQSGLLILHDQSFYPRMMPGIWSDAVITMHLGDALSAIITGLVMLYAAITALQCVKEEGMTPRSVLVMALGTVIALPYAFNYDMVMVAGALAVWLASEKELPVGRHLLFGILWALPLALVELKGVPFVPASSLILLGAFACLLRAGKPAAVSGSG